MKPKVSVLTTVYNGKKYIKETIKSVLNQTFRDFEFIIVDDGSIDNTEKIIKSFKDNRIKYIKKERNEGFFELDKPINLGLSKCKGKYIARLDADDLMMRNRLQVQFDYLEKHPEIFMIGSSAYIINKDGRYLGMMKKRSYFSIFYKYYIAVSNSFIHSTIMFRNEGLKYPSYNEHLFYCLLIYLGKKIKNIPDFLVLYRKNPEGMIVKYGGKSEYIGSIDLNIKPNLKGGNKK